MIAGILRHVITLEQPTETRAASGAVTNGPWTPFATVRAKVDPKGGSERFAGDQFLAQATHFVTIRYLPGLTPKMRVNFKGRYFDILNINDIEERNREMELVCKEGRSQGNV